MADKKAQERHRHLAANHLDELWEHIEDDLESEPTVEVALAVLVAAIRDGNSEPFSQESAALRAFEWKEGGRSRSTLLAEAVVDGLGDHVFVRAADFLAEVLSRIELDNGAKPSLQDFCKLLISAASLGARCQALATITQLKPRLTEGEARAVRARVGDIVEIPSGTGGAYRAVVIARNTNGTAYGILAGPSPHMLVRPKGKVPLFVYSGERAIKEGRWRIIGSDEAALAGFPTDPEIYLEKAFVIHANDPKIGPFGAAMAQDGSLRQISREEAEEVGLLNGEYEQSMLEPRLEKWLDKHQARLWPKASG